MSSEQENQEISFGNWANIIPVFDGVNPEDGEVAERVRIIYEFLQELHSIYQREYSESELNFYASIWFTAFFEEDEMIDGIHVDSGTVAKLGIDPNMPESKVFTIEELVKEEAALSQSIGVKWKSIFPKEDPLNT